MNNNNNVEINIIKSDNNITINIQKAQSKNIDGMNFQNGESDLFNIILSNDKNNIDIEDNEQNDINNINNILIKKEKNLLQEKIVLI